MGWVGRMSMGSTNRVVLVIGLCLVAWLIGAQSGHLYGAIKKKLTAKSRAEITAEMLAAMKTIQVGGKLPDYSFEDLDGNRQYLSAQAIGPTILAVISLSCESCLKQIEMLGDTSLESEISQRLIIVSSGNPVRLKQLTDSLQFKGAVLWDEDRAFQSNLHIDSYPFNLFLDSGLIVKNVIVGSLKLEDFEPIR